MVIQPQKNVFIFVGLSTLEYKIDSIAILILQVIVWFDQGWYSSYELDNNEANLLFILMLPIKLINSYYANMLIQSAKPLFDLDTSLGFISHKKNEKSEIYLLKWKHFKTRYNKNREDENIFS